ncbi:MAG: immunoglobulin domain-containing protein [Phycisphaerae bacterium]|nr:immunoglobulin domain-containing protein [Phycisphaerae bacterium]
MKKVFIVILALCLAMAGTAVANNGELLYEYWSGIGGTAIADLTANANYPNNPSGSQYLTSFEAPWDWADDYGAQITGYVVAPETGSYTFYIAADDGADLWLSTDTNPANATQIAFIGGWVARNNFTGGTGAGGTDELANQKSMPISLVANQKYWIRARNKEGGGGDNLSVGWTGPGINGGPNPITSAWIASDPWGRHKAINPTPASGTTGVDPTMDMVVSWETPTIEAPGPIVRYDVYADTSIGIKDPNTGQPLIASVNAGDPLTITIPASMMDYNTTYYWRVDTIVKTTTDARDPNNAAGNLWQFQTLLTYPVIDSQPGAQYVDAGDTATFTVAAGGHPAGGGLRYQWYHNGAAIPGETGTTLEIVGVDSDDEGNYYCEVKNDAGPTNSATVPLIIKALVAWYPLDGDVLDYSGMGPDGTVWGVGAEDPNQMFSESLPGLDQCIGVNISALRGEYVVFGDVGITGNMARSITCWAKNAVPVAEITDWCNIFGFTSDAGTAEMSFDFNKQGGTTQYCIHRYGAEWSMGQIDGQWHFLAATFVDGVVKWYFDGAYGGQATTNLQTQPLLHLGKRGAQSANTVVWRGWVDDARVYNYPLSDTEVAVMYTEIDTEAMVCVGGNPVGDLSGNCRVDLPDLVIMASAWLECNLVPDCLP